MSAALASARRICAEQAAGRVLDVDPNGTVRALVWLNESYLRETLGRVPFADLPTVVDVLDGEVRVRRDGTLS